jgi:Protein of unknown function (DUF3040)
MLDDESRVLTEIEHQLRLADPAFATRMTAPDPRPFPTITVLFLLLFVTAPLISLLFGLMIVAVMTAAVLVVVAAVLLHRHRGPA